MINITFVIKQILSKRLMMNSLTMKSVYSFFFNCNLNI